MNDSLSFSMLERGLTHHVRIGKSVYEGEKPLGRDANGDTGLADTCGHDLTDIWPRKRTPGLDINRVSSQDLCKAREALIVLTIL